IQEGRSLFCGDYELFRLSLIYDKEKRVQLLIDKGLMNVTYIGCHPCTNTCSLKIKMEDILTVWLPATGHDDMKVIE
ncbi:hypothetical protein DW646_23165, partial [Bacteroides sp. AM23-18]